MNWNFQGVLSSFPNDTQPMCTVLLLTKLVIINIIMCCHLHHCIINFQARLAAHLFSGPVCGAHATGRWRAAVETQAAGSGTHSTPSTSESIILLPQAEMKLKELFISDTPLFAEGPREELGPQKEAAIRGSDHRTQSLQR